MKTSFPVLVLAACAISGATSAAQTGPTQVSPNANSQTIIVNLPERSWKPTSIELVYGGIFFQVEVNGRLIWAMLDNGLDRSTIDSGFARQLGLRADIDPGSLSTLNQVLLTSLVHGAMVNVANQLNFQADLVGTDLKPLSALIGRPIGFVLGNEYLSNLAYFIDTQNWRLYLRRSGKIRPNTVSTRVPLVQGKLIDATLNGKPVRLKLDLGFNGTVKLSRDAWLRSVPANSPTRHSSSFDASGRKSATTLALSADFRLGEIRATMPVSTDQGNMLGTDGFIGMGFFRYFNTLVDTPRGEMMLIPHQPGQTVYEMTYTSGVSNR